MSLRLHRTAASPPLAARADQVRLVTHEPLLSVSRNIDAPNLSYSYLTLSTHLFTASTGGSDRQPPTPSPHLHLMHKHRIRIRRP